VIAKFIDGLKDPSLNPGAECRRVPVFPHSIPALVIAFLKNAIGRHIAEEVVVISGNPRSAGSKFVFDCKGIIHNRFTSEMKPI